MDAKVAKIAETFGLNEEELINRSLHEFLERELAYCEAEMFKLMAKYDVKSAEDMEELYKRGELDEADTWEDFFKLDHLEAKRRELVDALKELQ